MGGSLPDYGQEVMSQKIVFRQTHMTMDEMLKEIILSRKINLSYAPDALNLNETILLPATEVTIGDLLKIIKGKPNVRLIIKGNLVIIKKAEIAQEIIRPVVLMAKPVPQQDSTEKRDTIIPRIFPREKELISSKTGAEKVAKEQVTAVLQQRLITEIESAKNQPVFVPAPAEKKKKQTKNDWMVNVGASSGISLMMHPEDSVQTIRSRPAICFEIKANIQRKLDKHWTVESGLGFNHSAYKLHSDFDFVAYADSIGMDSIKNQDIKLQMNSLEIPLLINYNLTINNGNFFIGIGGSLQYALWGKRSFSNTYNSGTNDVSWNSSSEANVIDRSYKDLNRFNYCLMGQIGFQKGNWSMVSQVKTGLAPLSKNQPGTTLTISLGITYRILP